MTPEEKIDHIYQAVMDIKAQISADKTICEARHESVNDRIHGLHKVVKGNGQKGLEQKLTDLQEAFVIFKTKVTTYATAYSTIGSFIGGSLAALSINWIKGVAGK